MRGSSLLVAIAVFGNGTAPLAEGENPNNQKQLTRLTSAARTQLYSHLMKTLESLAAAAEDGGVRVTVALDVTHPLPPLLAMPSSLTVNVSIHPHATFSLAGKYRPRFRDAASSFDWLMVADYDLNVRSHTLDALCSEFSRLAHRPELYPSVMLYERESNAAPVVDSPPNRDLKLEGLVAPGFQSAFQPYIERLEEVSGRRYMVLRNPYQAMWLLPARRFRQLQATLKRRKINWLSLPQPHWPIWPKTAAHPEHSTLPGGSTKRFTQRASYRALYAGGWLFGFLNDGPSLTAVVPRDSYSRFLVHHQTDLYIRDHARWRRLNLTKATARVSHPPPIADILKEADALP